MIDPLIAGKSFTLVMMALRIGHLLYMPALMLLVSRKDSFALS